MFILIQERIYEKILASDINVFPLSKTKIKINIKKSERRTNQTRIPSKKTRWLF
jgi:hypothetical protein